MTAKEWRKELQALVAVMNAWYLANETMKTERDAAADYIKRFQTMGNGDPTASLKSFGKQADTTDWRTLKGFFRGPAVRVRNRTAGASDDFLWPLVSVDVRAPGDDLELSLRAALYSDDEGMVHAWGWRFETGDEVDKVGPHSHPYCHVQHISTWQEDGRGFEPPGYTLPALGSEEHPLEELRRSPDAKPAFPLGCRTPAGLAVAAIVSIYGPQHAAAILKPVPQIDKEFALLTGASKSEFGLAT